MKNDRIEKLSIDLVKNEPIIPGIENQLSINDKELWNLFRKGDEGAFIEIYKCYSNILFNFGSQICDDKELVKDCLQDFFLYIRDKRSKLSETDSIKLYLIKSFRRKIIDYVKKWNNENKKLNINFIEFPIELSHESIFIQRQLENENLKKLEKALVNLDVKEREAIYHFYYENLSYTQIAEILEFSHVSSARRLIYRALTHLRKLIGLFLILIFGSLTSYFFNT